MLNGVGGGAAAGEAEVIVIREGGSHDIGDEGRRGSPAVQDGGQQFLLLGMQAAGDAVLVNGTAVILVTGITGVSLRHGPCIITASRGGHLFPLADESPVIGDQDLALHGVPARLLVTRNARILLLVALLTQVGIVDHAVEVLDTTIVRVVGIRCRDHSAPSILLL